MPITLDKSKAILAVLHTFNERDRTLIKSQLSSHYDIVFCSSETDIEGSGKLTQARAILARTVSRELLDRIEALEFVQTPGTGVDGIDIDAILERNLKIANSHSAAPYVAEHAVALLLNAIKKISVFDRQMREHRTDVPLRSDSLRGKTIGIAGAGHVGTSIAELLRGFEVDVLACRRRPPTNNTSGAAISYVGIQELLTRSDVLFVCLPLTNQTRNLIGSHELGLLSHNAYLINVGRAEVISKKAFLEALSKDRLAGVALDVWWGDDGPPSALLENDRVILSPHRAGSDGAGPTYLAGAIESLRQFAVGEPLTNLVDPVQGY